MSVEELSLVWEALKVALCSNIDMLLVNTSVFFFAHSYIQSKKKWERNLKKTNVEPIIWGDIVRFKEDPTIEVTEESVDEHPNWTVLLSGAEISGEQFKEYWAWKYYDEGYEIKYANERRDRCAVVFGGILLALGSYISLEKNCQHALVALVVFLCYAAIAALLIFALSYLIKKTIKVKVKPERPDFLVGD